MTSMDECARVDAAIAALRAAGIAGTVEVSGFARDIAVVQTADADPLRLRDVAPQIKAAGFRYVAIDLASAGADG